MCEQQRMAFDDLLDRCSLKPRSQVLILRLAPGEMLRCQLMRRTQRFPGDTGVVESNEGHRDWLKVVP